MRVHLTDLKTGWQDVGIGMTPTEIDAVIRSLKMLRDGEIDHLHFTRTNWEEDEGVADVEISLLAAEEPSTFQV